MKYGIRIDRFWKKKRATKIRENLFGYTNTSSIRGYNPPTQRTYMHINAYNAFTVSLYRRFCAITQIKHIV